MTSLTNQITNIPVDLTRKKMDDINKKALRRKPQTDLEIYGQANINTDWTIQEQPEKKLSIIFDDLIGLQLRDEGNALIEATREINNRYIGFSSRALEVILPTELDIIELREKLLIWAEAVTKAIIYKKRRLIAQDPINLYDKLYKSFLSEIDQKIAHGTDHLYSFAWRPVTDAIPYWMIDAFFLQPNFLELVYEGDKDKKFISKTSRPISGKEQDYLLQQTNLYGVEPTFYSREIVLKPLSNFIIETQSLPSEAAMRKQIISIFSDLLEAAPYLISSTRADRYMFSIPGGECFGTFIYGANHGLARFCFSESRENLLRGIETSYFRGLLNINFFGEISFAMHPWMTLQRVFGESQSISLAYWLLNKIHPLVVEDYLKIKKHHLSKEIKAHTAPMESTENYIQSTPYSQWIDEAKEIMTEDGEDDLDTDNKDFCKGKLPQLRRSRFFKILTFCGVEISQGKGSEIKFLKPNAHPFRLGNHYGPNPTIPSFLAENILKRLEITHEEWRTALSSS